MKNSYENNPLNIAVNGLDLLFSKAKSVGIFFLVLLGVGFLMNVPSAVMQEQESPSDAQLDDLGQKIQSVPFEIWLIIGAIIIGLFLVILFFQILVSGISDYTTARLLKGKPTTLGEAVSAVFTNFWGYGWVVVLVGIKTFLWTLLFIVPGFYFSFRYSLAGVSFFDKKLHGNAAIKDSLALTRGGWLTTFAAHALLPLLTFGLTEQLVVPGARAILYRQFTDTKEAKPSAHILSWLTLILPIVLCVLFLLFIAAIVNYIHATA